MENSIYEKDLKRLIAYLENKFPFQEFIYEIEYDQAYAEYERLYPMNLVVYETWNEMLFYNRPIGEMQHFWKIPFTSFVWEKGRFFKSIPENFYAHLDTKKKKR